MIPIGTIVAFAGNIPPDGWLFCDGRPLSSAGEFSELYEVIRRSFGAGYHADGTRAVGCDFNLPDLRGVFLRGVDRAVVDSDAAGAAPVMSRRDPNMNARIESRRGGNRGADGAFLGTFQQDATRVPSSVTMTEAGGHRHTVTAVRQHTDHAEGGGDRPLAFPNQNLQTSSAGNHRHTLQGGDAETRPANVAVHYIIRYLP